MKLKAPPMVGRNGRGMWKMPRPKPFQAHGIALGTWVMFTRMTGDPSPRLGQVWARGRGHDWIVADGTEYHVLSERNLLYIVTQADNQLTLLESAS